MYSLAVHFAFAITISGGVNGKQRTIFILSSYEEQFTVMEFEYVGSLILCMCVSCHNMGYCLALAQFYVRKVYSSRTNTVYYNIICPFDDMNVDVPAADGLIMA